MLGRFAPNAHWRADRNRGAVAANLRLAAVTRRASLRCIAAA